MATKAALESYLQLPQIRAALDTIAWAEGGKSYNTLYGGGTFTGIQHPNRAITAGAYTSTAAGRYQFLYGTWLGIKTKLGLADFSPRNQDIATLKLIDERGQLGKLLNGDFEGMMRGLGCAWAALPYSTCRQKMRPLGDTMNYYNGALRVYGGKAKVTVPAAIAGSSGALVFAVLAVAMALLFAREE